ncbi:DNA repair protein RecO [Natronospira bacteriovora]|uniref:DNA repair protein RecO n=1 Tax=Natronospira bacteriovora TaxID=3069753 RepID=A0ABU0W2Q0_9GAMM|nr:DNA repair protein RecO [Natronospira sp. AB-CW4]MDQ2068284.1 DNA repair protein RecO [Natronospira sp. AB-CW4]
MSDRRPQLQAAYVLHHLPYRDSSLILHVFSREQGRLVLVARGARRPRSSQRALLQAFRPLLLSWRLGGEMGTLTAVESAGSPLALAGERLLAGFYVNELILRLAGRQDPHPELYAVYEACLHRLGTEESMARVLRRFEAEALTCIGYGLPLGEDCLDGFPIEADRLYRFDPSAGPRRIGGEAGTKAVSGRTLLALQSECWDSPEWDDAVVLRESRRLLAQAMEPYLGGKPLKSAQVLRDIRRRGRHQMSEKNPLDSGSN